MACLELLSDYCGSFFGESSTLHDGKSNSINISKKSKKSKDLKKKSHKKVKSSSSNSDQNDLNHPSTNSKLAEKNLVTDDGFKIINEIPPDDSDVSDAFESDIEDFEVCAKLKETEDGFKIINEIPPDDSDVEDAFESDLDEEEFIDEAKSRLEQKSNINNNNDNKLKPELEKLKKPLLNLIQDFGMEDKIYLNEESKLTLKQSKIKGKNTKQRNTLSDKDLQIVDHSKKRGKKRKQIEKPPEKENPESKIKSKKDAEADLKKARYEIYKLGITAGTQVEKKQAKIDLVVKLGAKPHKNTAMNYKKVIQLSKEKKEKEKQKLEETREMGLPVKKKHAFKTKNKEEIDLNPGLGKFSNGILKLSKKEIEAINAS